MKLKRKQIAQIAELQAELRKQGQVESEVKTTPVALRGRKRSTPSSNSDGSSSDYEETPPSSKKRRCSPRISLTSDDYKKKRKRTRYSKQDKSKRCINKISAVVMQIIQLCLIKVNYI